MAVALTTAPAANAFSAPHPTGAQSTAAAVVTLRYDDSRATGWEAAVTAGVASWNTNVDNVKLVKASPGTRADIQFVATSGWPQATLGPVRPGGRGRIELGSQAVALGHDKTRIAAHEIGHNLGLWDTKPGPCSQLMSGSSAGATCKNAIPDAAEQAQVEAAYAARSTSVLPAEGGVLVVDDQ
ncbi:secreted protease [Streptomyces clavuligerus]|nr:secreted protease [Streptomyces clavuligerus]